jgi:hypothetical protein
VVQLAGQQAASSAGAGAWLHLSPDTMHQYRLHSQQIMLVSVNQGIEFVDVACCLLSAACAALTPLCKGSTSARHEPCLPLHIQVGLCHPPEVLAGAGAAFSSPARPRSPYSASSSSFASPGGVTPSKFAPSAVVLAPDQVQLVDLWRRAGLVQDNSSQGMGLRRHANSAGSIMLRIGTAWGWMLRPAAR